MGKALPHEREKGVRDMTDYPRRRRVRRSRYVARASRRDKSRQEVRVCDHYEGCWGRSSSCWRSP